MTRLGTIYLSKLVAHNSGSQADRSDQKHLQSAASHVCHFVIVNSDTCVVMSWRLESGLDAVSCEFYTLLQTNNKSFTRTHRRTTDNFSNQVNTTRYQLKTNVLLKIIQNYTEKLFFFSCFFLKTHEA